MGACREAGGLDLLQALWLHEDWCTSSAGQQLQRHASPSQPDRPQLLQHMMAAVKGQTAPP